MRRGLPVPTLPDFGLRPTTFAPEKCFTSFILLLSYEPLELKAVPEVRSSPSWQWVNQLGILEPIWLPYQQSAT